MASSFVVTRETKSGARRFVVRYRLGGRAWPVQHGGSLSTMREARARRDLIAGELAAGRNPAEAREVAHLAGHSRASESLDTYSHVMPLDELAAERLRALMGS
jgi:hypothetical protein